MTRKRKPSGRRTGKPRSINDLSRTQGNLKPKKVIIIICEGKKTEPLYFGAIRQTLRLSSLNIRIVPGQGAPISIVDRAIEEKRCLDKHDDIWCVFDVEQVGKNPTLEKAVDKAKRNKLRLGITNPAFEYWYLLHFECTDRPFLDADRVIIRLKDHLPNYEKNLSIYEIINKKQK